METTSELKGRKRSLDESGAPSSAVEKDTKDAPSSDRNNDPGDGYQRLNVFGEHKRAVSSVKWAPSKVTKKEGGAIVASASASSFIKVWDIKQESWCGPSSNTDRHALTPLAVLVGHSRGINEVCWNPSAPLLASASDDKTVRIWDAVTGDSLVECKGHDNFVFCVDQHHAMIVSGSFDETVKLWDIRSGECFTTLPAHSDPVTAVSFNRDGTCVSTASHDGLIRIWDVATGECLKTIFAAKNPPVSSVKYSPNGKYLLAGTLDNTIRLWPVHRTGSSKCAKTYQSKYHVNTKYSIASDFLHDGNIVTGSETNHVLIYDLQTRKVLQVLDGHDDAVLAVGAHDKLPLIASGGMTADRKIEFWYKATDVKT